MLLALIADNENTVSDLIHQVEVTAEALNAASAQVVADQEGLVSAQGAESAAELALSEAEAAESSAQSARNEAQGVFDGEIETLSNEQQVLREVIAMLETLIPSGGWSEFSRDVACEGNGSGRDSACDVANGGGLECCQGSAEERGFQYVVWWNDQCYATTTCDDPYNLVDTVNYHNEGASLISVTQRSSAPNAGTSGDRRLLSLESDIIKNPKKFVAEMSKADPGAVQNIIDMLLALIADNENTVSDLIHQVEVTAEALNAASAQVVADQEGLESAQGAESAAELALSEAEA